MPARYLMSWEPSTRRWFKSYRRRRYVVSCRQLGVPETKEGSYQAANAWWIARRAEIDGAPLPHPHADTLASLNKKRDWARRHLQTDLAARLTQDIQATEKRREDQEPEFDNTAATETIQIIEMLTGADLSGLDPHVAQMVFGDGRVWRERFERDSVQEVVTDDLTVGGQVKAWVATQEARVAAHEVTPARLNNNRICLNHFRDHLGAELPVKAVDAARWEGFYRYVLGKMTGEKPWSRDYAQKVLAISKQFVRFVWGKGLIELPRNLGEHGIKRVPKAIATLTREEINKLFDKASEPTRLYLLLMANTGMLPKDIANLKNTEVDWDAGRVIRRRCKTDAHDDVPIVNYRLWPVTFDLLRRQRRPGEYALLTSTGRKLVDERWEGKLVSKDAITTAYNRLQESTGIKKPLKLIRKTSASLLESHEVYGRCTSLFLGHSPRSMKDRHYAAPPQNLFDEAVIWLGEQFGFGTNR